MGDHRASIKIEFSMYGETKKADMWINWSDYSSECGGVDQRVVDFFRNSAEEMYTKFMENEWAAERKRKKRQEEEEERNEFARLKAKYEPGNATGGEL